MKERPIIFCGPMVRAIIDGRKTQTRRLVKPQPVPVRGEAKHAHWSWRGGFFALRMYPNNSTMLEHCPYGKPGDRLYVRETWAHDGPDLATVRARLEDAMPAVTCGPYYRATEFAPDTLRWRPSIHMPKWASRIKLEVVSTRIERLKEITEADAKAEGAEPADCCIAYYHGFAKRAPWDSNPWVWCISFRRLSY